MADAFGSRWTSNYGDEPSQVWLGELANLTDEQVREGIRRTVEVGHEWPPTLGQFMGYCKAAVPACHRPFPELPKPPQDKDLGRREADAIREMLKA